MASFHIEQFGCRVTQADAAAIARELREVGAELAPDAAAADFVVVNTCTVTAAADAQARDAIRTIHRRNPAARIVVTGCYAQRAPEEIAALPGVDWVVGNSHKPEISRLFGELTALRSRIKLTAPRSSSTTFSGFVPLAALGADPASLGRAPARILAGNILEQAGPLAPPAAGGRTGHTRPILKIQDGCNNRCAFCVIPFVRGRSRSLPPAAVILALHQLITSGAREVVLSGVNLGAYGRDLSPRVEFLDLLKRILDETPIERLRVSSIEPMDVTEDLINLFASTERLARHFHLPLQSGSDRILAAMHRWYRAEHYARRLELIREQLPDAAIGADVIAGFPGETQDDHAATLRFIERLPFTYLHVFSFSERPGTAAAKLGGRIASAIVRRRARELRARGAEKAAGFLRTQIGRTLRVLTLNTPAAVRGHSTDALSTHYLRVRVNGSYAPNLWLHVRVVDRSAVTQGRVRAVLAARKKVDRSAVTHKNGMEGNRLLAEPDLVDPPPYPSKITCASAC